MMSNIWINKLTHPSKIGISGLTQENLDFPANTEESSEIELGNTVEIMENW